MKPIEARNQVRLGLGRCLQLALTGMSFRMFRSGITMAILALAVAFLVHMLAHGLIAKETRAQAWAELADSRAMGELITRLSSADTVPMILDALAAGREARQAEYRQWSGLDARSFEVVLRNAQRSAQAETYLMELPLQQQSVLLGDRTPRQMLDQLADEDAYALFVRRLETLGIPAPLGEHGALRRLIDEQRPALLEAAEAIRAGHQQAIAQVRRHYPDTPQRELAIAPPDDFVATLNEAGFSFEASQLPALIDFARRADDLRKITALVLDQRVRAAIARRTSLDIGNVSTATTFDRIRSDADAHWLAETFAEAGAAAHLDGARLKEMADHYRRHRALQDAAGDTPPQQGAGLFGLSEWS